jgi:hypothetical protein
MWGSLQIATGWPKPALAAYMFDQVSQVAIGDRRRNPRQVNSGGKNILHRGKSRANPGRATGFRESGGHYCDKETAKL